MNYDIPQQVPQRSDGTQGTENHRIAEIADELERLCKVHETQSGVSKTNVNHLETEQRVAEQMAKARGFWIPMMDVFNSTVLQDLTVVLFNPFFFSRELQTRNQPNRF